jgi:predicted dehydrogenase
LRKLKFGLVGGGIGSFIGPVHRIAAEMDGLATLVCGAFSSDPERSKDSAQSIYRLPQERAYASFEAMFAQENLLPVEQRMDFVVIATPNHLHYPVAMAALDAGFHVVCDKPVAFDLDQALELQRKVEASGLAFALTHNYTGYPMIRQARAMIEEGKLGSIRRVNCEYLQGWLAQPLLDNKQADWRTDPQRAGAAGCFGDIGSHGENLISYVTGLHLESLCADITTFVPGRQLEDDGNVLLRFAGGAKGILSVSQIALGKENDLRLQVFGDRASIEWCQDDANSLVVRHADGPMQVLRSGWAGTNSHSIAATRLPPGHPEGYLEAFAEVYRNFCNHLLGGSDDVDYPGIAEGLRGMQFIQSVVNSARAGAQWVRLT